MRKIYTLSIPVAAFLVLTAMAVQVQIGKVRLDAGRVPQVELARMENAPGGDSKGSGTSSSDIYNTSEASTSEEPDVYNHNSLRMVRSTSNETSENGENFEYWVEGADEDFFSGEKTGSTAGSPGIQAGFVQMVWVDGELEAEDGGDDNEDDDDNKKYSVLLSDGGNASGWDRPVPQKEARYSNDNKKSDSKDYDGECEEVNPQYKTGHKYGIYTKTIVEEEETTAQIAQAPLDGDGGGAQDNNQNAGSETSSSDNGDGILAVWRIDASGPALGTRDQFPPYTATLSKRAGVLYKEIGCKSNEHLDTGVPTKDRILVGEPVIIVQKGGDVIIPSNADGEGTQRISFYGVECRDSNTWTFRAKDRGFNPREEDRKWYRKRVDQVSPWEEVKIANDPSDPKLKMKFPEGRWWVKLEYTKKNGDFLAKAEIHSLVVEKHRSTNVPQQSNFQHGEARGAKFDLVGRCDSSISVDAAVYIQKSRNGVRGRVSLDGYPQNEYWGGFADVLDIPQVVQLRHETAVFAFIQGYERPSYDRYDRAILRVDGQALLETSLEIDEKNKCETNESGYEEFSEDRETPVAVRWEKADTEQFLSIEVEIDPTDTGMESLGDLGNAQNNNINAIENPASVIIQAAPQDNTVAIFRATCTRPRNFLAEDDEKLVWNLSENEGKAGFFREDNTGTVIRVSGDEEGDVVAGGRLKHDVAPVVTIRARVVREETFPVRVNVITPRFDQLSQEDILNLAADWLSVINVDIQELNEEVKELGRQANLDPRELAEKLVARQNLANRIRTLTQKKRFPQSVLDGNRGAYREYQAQLREIGVSAEKVMDELPRDYDVIFEKANIILRQSGIRFEWDRDATLGVNLIGGMGEVKVENHGVLPGVFKVEGGYGVYSNLLYPDRSGMRRFTLVNHRPGVIDFAIVPISYESGLTALSLFGPENLNGTGCYGEWNENSKWEEMYLFQESARAIQSAEAGDGVTFTESISIVVFLNGWKTTDYLRSYILAHETLHGFQIAHNFCHGEKDATGTADGRTENKNNLMVYPTMMKNKKSTPTLDIDLLQKKAMEGSLMFR